MATQSILDQAVQANIDAAKRTHSMLNTQTLEEVM